MTDSEADRLIEWYRELHALRTPEDRARAHATLSAMIARIPDPIYRHHMTADFQARLDRVRREIDAGLLDLLDRWIGPMPPAE